ncbi:hypothetical protein IscW_ISCW005381 [Ixodes scapularis]|uniref:Uncharacterized protein n=1 Tax=Ixodes scapularis TaxID=6945 RepID=B7PN86_IXOSC|nr:hypothetical protein IscW_ISCW005381 [Ixodes scapularis]|eukprot:XP_002435234.1 hypothetical protein IscW_ISCW005381 [Ixodes scapularis]
MTAFVQKSNPHEQNVKTAEIKMSAFVAEHALSFKAMDHLGELAKVLFHDSALAKVAATEDRIVAAKLILKDMNPITEANLLTLEELYVGAGCQGILDKITIEEGSS